MVMVITMVIPTMMNHAQEIIGDSDSSKNRRKKKAAPNQKNINNNEEVEE